MRGRILQSIKDTAAYSFMIFTGVFFVMSVFSTFYFDFESISMEHPLYKWDNPLWFFIFAALFCGLLYFFDRKIGLEKLPSEKLLAVLSMYVFAVSVYWTTISGVFPKADQEAVSFIASLAVQDNFLFFRPEKYMQIYPNQLGMVFILEMLYRLSGGENFRLFQYLNCVANCVIYGMLYLFVKRCFQKKKITNIFLILCFGYGPLILQSTFVYGTSLGLAFALAAVNLELKFLEEKNYLSGVGAALCISFSVIIKNNYSIFLVAMILLLLYKGIKKKGAECFLLALVFVLFLWGTGNLLTAYYENRSGMELGKGMPKILWIAMGMQEGERGEGWYNGFNYDTFRETGCDAQESSEIAKKAISESLENFKRNPAYALRFYFRKFASQWNEPTYETFYVNISHEGEFSTVMQSLYDGKLNRIIVGYMDLYQSLILLGALVILIKKRDAWTEEQLLLPLMVLGGFLFHMFWEAKSQYIISYFILLLPYGAAGIDGIKKKGRT